MFLGATGIFAVSQESFYEAVWEAIAGARHGAVVMCPETALPAQGQRGRARWCLPQRSSKWTAAPAIRDGSIHVLLVKMSMLRALIARQMHAEEWCCHVHILDFMAR